jgi:hypothetical protein
MISAMAAAFNCCTMFPPPAVVFSPPEVKFACADTAVGALLVMTIAGQISLVPLV